jgi:glycosyltransferase involved in cell wall biosynthesis
VLSGVIAESPQQAVAAQDLYGPKIRVASIPHLGFYATPQPRLQRTKSDELRIAYAGRLDIPKGVFRLLDLWPKLAIQPARLDYFGDGPTRSDLIREVQRRGLSAQVEVHGGWRDEHTLGRIFQNVDFLVLPSDHPEGLPITLLESMAHGVPFVASDQGAIRTLAVDNPDVRVVPLDTIVMKKAIEEMAAAIRSGQVRGDRLQQYSRARYSYQAAERRWIEALLDPDAFWARENPAT